MASSVKIHLYLVTLSPETEKKKQKQKKKKKKKTDMSRADNSVKNWRNFPIRSPKLAHNINVRNVWWKSINIYSIYRSKT